MILFPEGTRSRNQILQSGKPGVAHLASITGCAGCAIWPCRDEQVAGNCWRGQRPTGDAEVEHRRAVQIVQDDGTPARRRLMSATDEIMRRIASLIPEANRGKFAETAGGPYRFTRDI